uniref:Uncharacterized protein n=1 Tax=Lygus hesperus TaxID=30085 RepID=A0A146L0X6_LYGHE
MRSAVRNEDTSTHRNTPHTDAQVGRGNRKEYGGVKQEHRTDSATALQILGNRGVRMPGHTHDIAVCLDMDFVDELARQTQRFKLYRRRRRKQQPKTVESDAGAKFESAAHQQWSNDPREGYLGGELDESLDNCKPRSVLRPTPLSSSATKTHWHGGWGETGTGVGAAGCAALPRIRRSLLLRRWRHWWGCLEDCLLRRRWCGHNLLCSYFLQCSKFIILRSLIISPHTVSVCGVYIH